MCPEFPAIKSLEPGTVEAFHDEFERMRAVPALAGKIRKFGNRYYGIRLLNDPSAGRIELRDTSATPELVPNYPERLRVSGRKTPSS